MRICVVCFLENQIKILVFITLCLAASSTDNPCKQFGPRSGSDMNPNCLILMGFLKYFF